MPVKKPNINLFLVLATLFLMLIAPAVLWFNKTELHLFTNQYHHRIGDQFFPLITHLGSVWMLLVGVCITLWMRAKEKLMHYLLAIGIAGLLISLTKYVLFPLNLRPLVAVGVAQLHLVEDVELLRNYSFVSGHSAIAFTFFYFFSLQTEKKIWQLLFIFCAVLVAFSRVYLSQHFWVDVWAGAICGIFSVILAQYISKTILKFSSNSDA